MPRLPDRVVNRLQTTSTSGARLASSEASALNTTEARAVAKQAIDTVENSQALATLQTRLGGEAMPAPLSSLSDLAAGRKWLDGTTRIGPGSPTDDVKVLQRALMKIGAHHPQGRAKPELMLLPWGADGSLGQGTQKALDAALRLANRADLTPVANRMPLGKDVAQALDGLLRSTPQVTLPPQSEVYPTTSSSSPQRLNVFGGVAMALNSTPYDTKWRGVLAKLDSEKSRYTPSSSNPAAVNTWLRSVEALRGKSQKEMLDGVNRAVNETPYKSDVSDEWKSPLEFIGHSGDCEDYAIAKYASLKKLGFDESRMRLLLVQDTVTRQHHAILAVDLPDATYILDNVNRQVQREQDLRYATGEPHYQPIMALSRTKSWLYGRAT